LTAILDLLGRAERVEVEEIVRMFGVSPATARRDLDALASRRLVNRTRGGATAHTVAYDLPLRYKRAQHARAKEAIAEAVMELIRPGSRIGLTGVPPAPRSPPPWDSTPTWPRTAGNRP